MTPRGWLALFKALLTLALWVSRKIDEDELRQDGEARAQMALLEIFNDRIRQASAARDAVPDGGLRDDDGYRRD